MSETNNYKILTKLKSSFNNEKKNDDETKIDKRTNTATIIR